MLVKFKINKEVWIEKKKKKKGGLKVEKWEMKSWQFGIDWKKKKEGEMWWSQELGSWSWKKILRYVGGFWMGKGNGNQSW